MDIYLAYLRKSRMDKDYETISLEETLKRHRAQLLELAERMGIILKEENIYEEVVSSESIASRPEIQKKKRHTSLLHVLVRVLSGAFLYHRKANTSTR